MNMKPRRRQILRMVGTACLVGNSTLVIASDRASNTRGGDVSVSPLVGDQWVASVSAKSATTLMGTPFEFWSVHGRAAAVLTDIVSAPLKGSSEAGWSAESFQLVFTVSESTRNLPRDLCNVIHPQLGSFELFVQSARNDKGVAQFVATFSRLAQ